VSTSQSSLSGFDRLKARTIAAIASPIVATLGRTLRWRSEGDDHLDAIMRSGRQPIFVTWHGRIFGGLYYFRNRGIVVITSRNFDGEWIAGIIERFGFGTARGSTSRGGVRALVQMRRDLAAGRPVGFTVDGPRGPARVVQRGAVWLAGATGHPILPFHVEADRFWEAPSWDRTQLPRPFATVAVAIGPPMGVPDATEATVEEKRRELEQTLETLEARARALLTGART
jgi:lysophospholipid acyltransferase (LPLAT)-like uncharacterized protein